MPLASSAAMCRPTLAYQAAWIRRVWSAAWLPARLPPAPRMVQASREFDFRPA